MLESARAELKRTKRDLDKTIQAIFDGVPGAQLKDRIGKLEDRKAELQRMLAEAEEPPPLLHPEMTTFYRQQVGLMQEALQGKRFIATLW